MFVFGDFSICHKGWLTYSGGTNGPGKLWYGFLDFFYSSDASICCTMAFALLGNSDHFVVPVSIDVPLNSKQDALFHCTACDYSHTD